MHAFFVQPAIVKRRDPWRALFAASLLALTALAPAGAAGAEEKLPDTFTLRLGGYNISNSDTVMRLDANSAPVGAYIDFHDTLGGERQAAVGRLDGLYRFNERHGLGFSWYRIKLTGSRVLDRDIQWGGETFPVNSQIESELKFNVTKVNYQYSLFHNQEAELGVSLGLHVMGVSANINGINQSQGQSITAPLPVWGFYAKYNFTPRFSAYYEYQMFNINYQDKVTGGLQDFLFGLEYRLFRNFALGAAYNRFALHMKGKGDVTTVYLDTNWNGGMLYGAVYF